MNASEFLGLLFLGRDFAHATHLNTKSYAKHVALNSFYHDVIDLADSFAEAYQGKHGLIGGISLQAIKKKGDIVEFLQNQLDEITAERYTICDKEETALQNIIDEIVALYLSTLYKLRFLS